MASRRPDQFSDPRGESARRTAAVTSEDHASSAAGAGDAAEPARLRRELAATRSELQRTARALAEANRRLAAIDDGSPHKPIETSLLEAKAEAERANRAKSHFLAAASHDLRQPLQAIGLLLGVLGKRSVDPETRTIVARLDDTIADMATLLDTLLDINQIESGSVEPEITDFSIAAVLARLEDRHGQEASARGLTLRVVPSSMTVRSDLHLLERMIGNLLTNALKYTDRGKVLLGCRRQGDRLRIEVWDTGVGIVEAQQQAIFDEFYRVDRTDSGKFGLGLGLYIVRRFAALLGHTVEVRSRPGKGTMFAVIVAAAEPASALAMRQRRREAGRLGGPTIILVEDHPGQLQTLQALFELEGYRVVPARTGAAALARIHGPEAVFPDILVCDYNLPGGMGGLEIVRRMRAALGTQVPALIVTGDKSPSARNALDASGLTYLNKPTKAGDLVGAVERLVRTGKPQWVTERKPMRPAAHAPAPAPTADADIGVIDDEPDIREGLRLILEAAGHRVATYPSSEAFLDDTQPHRFRCLVVDLTLPGLDGLGLQARLKAEQRDVPIVFVTGRGNLPIAVAAMRAGAADFLRKPVRADELLASVTRALASVEQSASLREEQEDIDGRLGLLTERERQVLKRMLMGAPTKIIGADLGISIRTAEHHRQSVMRKMAAKSLAMLVRMVGSRADGA